MNLNRCGCGFCFKLGDLAGERIYAGARFLGWALYGGDFNQSGENKFAH